MRELKLENGQCGLCQHFGEDHGDEPTLVQIRSSKSAPADLAEPCGHPQHEDLRLVVTAVSGCEGFVAAA